MTENNAVKAVQKKAVRNAHLANPKKNPARRRVVVDEPLSIYIAPDAMKPKRNALGNPIPGKFVPYWPGARKVSKYAPHVGNKQLARKEAARG
jgi:hypothetical protein